MEIVTPRTSRLATAVSWAALFVALVFLAFLAWFIPADRRVCLMIFRDFQMKLPVMTELMLAIPDLVFPITALVVAIALIGAHFRVRNKSAVALLHMVVIVLCCIVLVAYRESLHRPLAAMIRAMAE